MEHSLLSVFLISMIPLSVELLVVLIFVRCASPKK